MSNTAIVLGSPPLAFTAKSTYASIFVPALIQAPDYAVHLLKHTPPPQ